MTSTIIYPEYPCITEAAIANFQPTYLMAKRHTKTGLMYFCKTTGPDPVKYLGSGTRWVRHMNKHGREHVETLWYQRFDDIYLLVEFALGFSEDADIVASKEWANLKPENGLDGGYSEINDHRQNVYGKNGLPGFGGENLSLHRSKASKISWKLHRETFLKIAREAQPLAVAAAQSESARQKRQATFQERQHQVGKKNSQYGTYWITDGAKPIKIKKEELETYIAQGYVRGRKWP